MPFAIKLILFMFAISLMWGVLSKLLACADSEYSNKLNSGHFPWYIRIMAYLVLFDIPAFIYLAGWFIFECM